MKSEQLLLPFKSSLEPERDGDMYPIKDLEIVRKGNHDYLELGAVTVRAGLRVRAILEEKECHYCGLKASYAEPTCNAEGSLRRYHVNFYASTKKGPVLMNIDHVIPRSKGGTHTRKNVVASCQPCNLRKADK